MVIHDGDFLGAGGGPAKGDSPLIIDANGVESFQPTAQRLKAVSRRHCQVLQTLGTIQLDKLPQRHPADCRIPPVLFLVKKLLCIRIGKGLDHNTSLPAKRPAVNSTGKYAYLFTFKLINHIIRLCSMSDRPIHISRQGAQYGPYPESRIKDLLANGQILPTDLAWFEGADNWQPIENIFMVDTGNETPAVTQGPTPENIPATTDHSAKIRVKRNDEEIGPYSWGKAKEYFIGGQLLPTDLGCLDDSEKWKPLHEILGLPLLATNSPSPDLKQGKTKKVAIIAGIVVLLTGLIFAGVTYGPMLGIVDAAAQKTGLKKDIIETPKELAEQTFDALKNKDFDALTKLYMTEAEARAWANDFFELEIPDADAKKDLEKLRVSGGRTHEEMLLQTAISDNPKQTLELAQEEHQDFWNKAADNGISWDDLEISSVGKFERRVTSSALRELEAKRPQLKTKLDESWAETKVKKGTFSIELTSNGNKFHLMLPCIYSPSTGFHLYHRYFIEDFKPKQ